MHRPRIFAGRLLPFIVLAFLSACAGAPVAPTDREEPAVVSGGVFSGLTERFRERALKAERAGELHSAIESWRVVASVRPGDAESAKHIAELEDRARKSSERHYQQGMERLKEGAQEAARKEFLLALIDNPDHAKALDALKNGIDPAALAHTVSTGETLEAISRKYYNDPGQATLIARINGLGAGTQPSPGAVLSIPIVTSSLPKGVAPAYGPEAEAPDAVPEAQPVAPQPARPPAPSAEPSKPADPAVEQLDRARELFKAQKYAEAIQAAEKLTTHPTLGKQAQELLNKSYLEIGFRALKEDRFTAAIEAYNKIDPLQKELISKSITAVERRKKEKAEELYNEGVRLFINQKIEEAIRRWESTLVLNPQHPKAPRDIEKANALLQKLKDIK